jgi:hypothetical protein
MIKDLLDKKTKNKILLAWNINYNTFLWLFNTNMPQLDFNTFTSVAWWLTIIFYISYLWFLIYPFARLVASEKAGEKYRLYKIIQLLVIIEEISDEDKIATQEAKN